MRRGAASVLVLVLLATGCTARARPEASGPSPSGPPLSGPSPSGPPLSGPPLSGPSPSGAPAGASPPATVPPRRKGVSTWAVDWAGTALADARVSWYFDWGPSRIGSAAGVEFVPMVWGAGSVTPATLATVRTQGRTLLGFNEPDFASQANMSVARALDLWPALMGTGMRLGSPAPATGAATAGGWLDRFMSGAATRGYRVDFVALHWYGADFSAAAVTQLRSYLQATYARYHKPIWLTEYALIAFGRQPEYPTPAQQVAFVRASTAMLDSLPYVERYAWFALPTPKGGPDGTGLYRAGAVPTPVGVAYRNVSS